MTYRFARRVAVLLCWLLWIPAAWSEQAWRYESHRQDGDKLIIVSDRGQILISRPTQATVNVEYIAEGEASIPSFSRAPGLQNRPLQLRESESELRLEGAPLRVFVNKDDLSISYYWREQALTKQLGGLLEEEGHRGFRFSLDPDEQLMGTGQRVLGMDRRGHRLPLYNKAHYGYQTESTQMYYSMPLVLSSQQYMVLFDNAAKGYVDLGKQHPQQLQFAAVGGSLSYSIVAGGLSYPGLIKNYLEYSGFQPLPPRWLLGNFASRFGYHNEAETREVVRLFQEHEIPLDAVVLDLFWFGEEIKGTMGNLDWHREAFPDPQGMMADFLEQGVKTVLITEPFILSTSKRWQEAVDAEVLAVDGAGDPYRFDFYFGNTGLIDIFKPEARDWFWDIYADLKAQGVAGWWGDLGEPEVHPDDILHVNGRGDAVHNAYGHSWAGLLSNRLQKHFPDERPFIMMRSGFAGSQRYGMVPWTGDVSRSWGGLKPQVELSLQMGLQGLAYLHSDLGGFAGGEQFDRELYIRWLQYGVFQPVYRPHAQEEIAPEPVFHDADTIATVKRYIDLRYRLLPYNYTLAFENSLTGMPLMRPLFFVEPERLEETGLYYWGDAFLVHPITDPAPESGLSEVEVELPPGVWFDFWSDEKLKGHVSREYDIETLPVWVRAGSFVPMARSMSSTEEYDNSHIELHYFADSSVSHSSGIVYGDDGRSARSISDGAFEILSFEAKSSGSLLTIELVRSVGQGGAYAGMPEHRTVRLYLHGVSSAPASVKIDDANTDFHFDSSRALLMLDVEWRHNYARLQIE